MAQNLLTAAVLIGALRVTFLSTLACQHITVISLRFGYEPSTNIEPLSGTQQYNIKVSIYLDISSFLASGDFCCLLIASANSLDPYLDQNHLIILKKKDSRRSIKNTQHAEFKRCITFISMSSDL